VVGDGHRLTASSSAARPESPKTPADSLFPLLKRPSNSNEAGWPTRSIRPISTVHRIEPHPQRRFYASSRLVL